MITKNKYLYFASRLFLLFLIVFLFDFSIGKFLRYFYFKQQWGRQYRATYAIEKTRADVVIFGSSRAYHHYVPNIIEGSLKLSCYNTGSPGQFLFYSYAVLKAVLKRYTPKVVILDVTANDLQIDNESYDRLSFLLPYYKTHEELRPIINLKSPFEKVKLLSSIYPFNSTFLMIAGGNADYFKKKTSDIKGYKPLFGIWDTPIEVKNIAPYKIDSTKLNIFKSFIEDCRKAETKLFIVCSPFFIRYDQKDYSLLVMKKIANEKNTDFIDFVNDTSFINHSYLFDNPGHLNARGAMLFTYRVMDSIVKLKKDLH